MHTPTILSFFSIICVALVSALPGNSVSPAKLSDQKNNSPTADMKANVKCNVSGQQKTKLLSFTAKDQTGGAYQHLIGQKGNAHNGAGPSNCGRVSCGYGLAVYFCNDVSKYNLLHLGPMLSSKYGLEIAKLEQGPAVSVPWSTLAQYTNDIGMVCGGGVTISGTGEQYFNFEKTINSNGQK